MSDGYRCASCKWVGTDPELERQLDKVDGGAARYVVAELCPDCGHDELDEVELCVDCTDNGADVEATHGEYCGPCAALNDDFKRDRIAPVLPLVQS
jgi:hypothetical protein